MKEFVKKHKIPCILAAIASVLVFVIYIFALFLPGYWYRDAFLFKKPAPFENMSVFSGHDPINSVDYEMTMAKDGIKTYIAFTINETERGYEIVSDNSESHYPKVEIYENGKIVFTGTYRQYLFDENEEPFVETPLINYYVPGSLTEEELFPSYNWLYDVSQSVKTEKRGNPVWLLFIAVFAGVMAIDMIYPDLYWELHHRIAVEGGQPSDFYRMMQKIGWILTPITIIIMMIASFIIKI